MQTPVLLASAAVVLLLISGCASAPPGVADTSPRAAEEFDGWVAPSEAPLTEDDVIAESPQASWIERGRTFAIRTWGSSSCPLVATTIEATEKNAIAVHFERSPHDPCTADMAPTTHEFSVPDAVSEAPLNLTVSYEGWDDRDSFVLE
jgi:hypothetical protein